MDPILGSIIFTVVYYLICLWLFFVVVPRKVYRMQDTRSMMITGLMYIAFGSVLLGAATMYMDNPFPFMATFVAALLGTIRVIGMYYRRVEQEG